MPGLNGHGASTDDGNETSGGWQRLDSDLLWRSLKTPAAASEPSESPAPATGSGDAPAICPMCRGAGWYTLDVRVRDPRFGVLQMCDCLRQRTQQQASAQRTDRQLAHLDTLQTTLREESSTMAMATFDSFRLNRPLAVSVTWCGVAVSQAYQANYLATALAAMQAYAANPVGWRMLIGPTGSGKSHLAGAVWSALRERGVPVLAATTEGLLRCLRQGIADHTTDDRLDTMQHVDVLILDDFGVEHRTPWALEKLHAVIHARAEANRPTLLTGNMPLDRLQPLTSSDPITDEVRMRWERMSSRILWRCGAEMLLIASDIRRHHGSGQQACPGV